LVDPSPCFWAKTAAAAIFICPEQDQHDLAENAANTFGLTLAETRVLAALLGGETLADIATTLRIAPTTARTHLQSIFGKTAVDRQTDLMRLAMQISSPINFSIPEA
jgi:DNA-binding CsgD family transcriptional regulator